MSNEEVRRMIAACRGLNRTRDRAFLALGAYSGFRNAELRKTTRRHVLDADGNMREWLEMERRNMKRKREGRDVPLAGPVVGYLCVLLDEMERRGLNRAESPLFFNRRTKRAIGASAAWRLVRRAAERAVVPTEKVGVHSLRKTCGGAIYENLKARLAAGEPVDILRELQDALGHTDPASTQKYLAGIDRRQRVRNFRAAEGILKG